MSSERERPAPVFVPPLRTMLLQAEDKKGEPLTCDEVIGVTKYA